MHSCYPGASLSLDDLRSRRHELLQKWRKKVTKLKMSSFSECALVHYDLEATGLTIPPDIVQIGAVSGDGNDYFSEYVRPTKRMEAGARRVTGLHTDKNLNLYRTSTGDRLPCREPRQALEEFLDWLKEASGGRKVALVAYNAFRFDTPVLLYQLERYDISYKDVIHGFIDPFVYVRDIRFSWGGYGLINVMRRFGVNPSGGQYHDAKWDADNLRKLTNKLMMRGSETHLDAEETKRRLLAVEGAETIFVKTTERFKDDLKRSNEERELKWKRYF